MVVAVGFVPQSPGIFDSTKVLKANRIAVELSKYYGTMAQVFEDIEFILKAYAAGQSAEETSKRLKENRRKNSRFHGSVMGKATDCEREYHEDFTDDVNGIVDEFNCVLLLCAAVAGSAAGMVALSALIPATGPVTVDIGAAGAVAGYHICTGATVNSHFRNMHDNNQALQGYLERCEEARRPE